MRIYLIRHGQTEWNTLQKFQGSLNPGLSPEGFRQAEQIASRCRLLPVKRLYTSPLARAMETAGIIALPLGLSPVTEDNFAEMNFGDLQGKTFSEVEAIYADFRRKWKFAPGSIGIKNLEPMSEFRQRVVTAFHKVIDINSEDSCIAIVTHGGVIAAIISYILDSNPEQMTRAICSNASLNLIEKEKDWFTLQFFNDTHHLHK